MPGHADWIRCLHFSPALSIAAASSSGSDYKEGDIILASGSQDSYIRLWRFTVTLEAASSSLSSSVEGSNAHSSLAVLDILDDVQDGEIVAKQYRIRVEGEKYVMYPHFASDFY